MGSLELGERMCAKMCLRERERGKIWLIIFESCSKRSHYEAAIVTNFRPSFWHLNIIVVLIGDFRCSSILITQ